MPNDLFVTTMNRVMAALDRQTSQIHSLTYAVQDIANALEAIRDQLADTAKPDAAKEVHP